MRKWLLILFGPDLVDWCGKHYWQWKLGRQVKRQNKA